MSLRSDLWVSLYTDDGTVGFLNGTQTQQMTTPLKETRWKQTLAITRTRWWLMKCRSTRPDSQEESHALMWGYTKECLCQEPKKEPLICLYVEDDPLSANNYNAETKHSKKKTCLVITYIKRFSQCAEDSLEDVFSRSRLGDPEYLSTRLWNMTVG